MGSCVRCFAHIGARVYAGWRMRQQFPLHLPRVRYQPVFSDRQKPNSGYRSDRLGILRSEVLGGAAALSCGGHERSRVSN
jgi:hypothetical protein